MEVTPIIPAYLSPLIKNINIPTQVGIVLSDTKTLGHREKEGLIVQLSFDSDNNL